MNQDEHIRHEAELDSRRVSTGLICRIVSDLEFAREPSLRGLLDLLFIHGYIPGHAKINYTTGYDVVSGTLIVIPRAQVSYISEELKRLVKTKSDTDLRITGELLRLNRSHRRGSTAIQATTYNFLSPLVRERLNLPIPSEDAFVYENVTAEVTQADQQIAEFASFKKRSEADFMKIVERECIIATVYSKGPFGVPTANLHDLYLHTREQSDAQAEIVPRVGIFQGDPTKAWTENHEPEVSKEVLAIDRVTSNDFVEAVRARNKTIALRARDLARPLFGNR